MVTSFKYVPFAFICLFVNSFLQNTCVSQSMCARFSDVQKKKKSAFMWVGCQYAVESSLD